MKKKKSNLWTEGERMGAVLLFLILLQFLNVGFCRAQSSEIPRLTTEFNKTPFVEVLNYIKANTRYDFLYNSEEMKKIPAVTRRFEKTPVTTILEECLKGTGYTFRISHNVIVIKREDKFEENVREVVLRGKVLDDKDISLPGATVMVKGTKLGVSTDEKGMFILTLPQTDTIRLMVTFVGMESQEVVVTNFRKEVVIKLKSDTKEVDEVVVTGYANIRKSSFTGNSVTVSRDELLKVSKTNIISALQVYDPSFRIKENNRWGSDPNALPEMQIRGQSGIGVKDMDRGNLSKSALDNNPNLPVFILDGFEVGVEKVYDMDPNRIQSVTILKDAAATASYGSRAANGVVVIETIKPKSGEVRVNYSMVGSLTMPDLTSYNLMNAEEKLEAERVAGMYNFNDPVEYRSYQDKLKGIARGVDTYWLSKPLTTEFNHKHSLFIQGGSNEMRYGLDMMYHNNNGVMKGSSRNIVGVGFTFEYLRSKVQVRNNISYTRTKSSESPYGAFSQYVDLLPYMEYKDERGNYLKSLATWSGQDGFNPNPLYEAKIGNYSKSQYGELIESLSVNWYIFPTLQFKGDFSVIQKLQKGTSFTHPGSILSTAELGDDPTLQGKLSRGSRDSYTWQGKLMVAYNEDLGLHNINLSAFLDIKKEDTTSESASYRGFPSGEFTSVSFAKEVVNKPSVSDVKKRLMGLVLQMNYSYNNIYLADVAARVEGSSEYGADHRVAPFWSLGLGLNIHNYSFLRGSVFSELKLRGSYGQEGRVGFAPYAAIPSHTIDINQWYATGSAATLMSTRGNRDLKWEKINKFEIGLKVGLLNDLIYLEPSYYLEVSNGLVTSDVTLPLSTGFSTYFSNVGKIENEGFEIQFRSNIIKRRDLFLAVFGNLSHNSNKIKKISDALRAYNDKVNAYYEDENNDWTKVMTKYEEGQSVDSKYGMKSLGIDPESGKELFLYRDGTVSYEWKATEMVNIGNEQEWGRGAFGVNLSYKKFSFSTAFTYKFGGHYYNETLIKRVENADFEKNIDKRALDLRWQKPGDIAMFKDIKDRNETTAVTSRFMQRLDELRWTSMNLEYDFSSEKLKRYGISMLRVSLGTEDLWRMSTVKTERGTDFPFANSMNFTLSLGF